MSGVRVVCDLVAGYIPVGDECVVSEIEGGVIGHLGLASIRVLALREELVDGIKGVALYGIVGGKDNEHGRVLLNARQAKRPRSVNGVKKAGAGARNGG